MNVNNYTNLDLIKYSLVLSLLIFLNYFLWSINSWEIIRSINFLFLLGVFTFFFISKKFNTYWYVRAILLLLLIICLGSPTIANDARTFFIFPVKILYYESDLYFRLNHNLSFINYDNHNFLDAVFSRPKLAASLSATFAQLLGTWNVIFPKSTNVILILPPTLFLISFLKDKFLILLWLFLMLFFSGKLFTNGLMDGILALYFVAGVFIVYKISLTSDEFESKLLYFLMFLFFVILSLIKHEGGVMVLSILFSSVFIEIIYKRKINFKFIAIVLCSLCPLTFWRYLFLSNNSKMEFLSYGNPVNRFFERITNLDDIITVLSYIIINEKLVISIIIFSFISYKYFNKYKKLIFYIVLNFLFYFSTLIAAVLLTTHTVEIQLIHSANRIFIPLVLMLSYFFVFLINTNLNKSN